jgi:hypothetical protein
MLNISNDFFLEIGIEALVDLLKTTELQVSQKIKDVV